MVMNTKQLQFNQAMEKFNGSRLYPGFGTFIASASVSLQLLLLYGLFTQPVLVGTHILAFVVAYVLADLLNGLVHMVWDHHENYNSIYGPLVAQFHLHHQIPKYTQKALPLVYFHETGAKVWLTAYLLLVWGLMSLANLPPLLLAILVYVGILSSVAEVSHYLCHNSNSKLVQVLGRMGILLSRKHHMRHHTRDNYNYAFLNGMSDPLINLIARRLYPGYKQTTDLHFAHYTAPDQQPHRF